MVDGLRRTYEPASPSEMPEAVSNAAMKLRHSARYCERDGYPSTASEEREIADALESWWRSQPVTFAYDVTPGGSVRVVAGDGSKWQCSQPAPSVAMTPELERVLETAEEAEWSIRLGFRLHSDGERHWKIREAIAAVRAQASQPQSGR